MFLKSYIDNNHSDKLYIPKTNTNFQYGYLDLFSFLDATVYVDNIPDLKILTNLKFPFVYHTDIKSIYVFLPKYLITPAIKDFVMVFDNQTIPFKYTAEYAEFFNYGIFKLTIQNVKKGFNILPIYFRFTDYFYIAKGSVIYSETSSNNSELLIHENLNELKLFGLYSLLNQLNEAFMFIYYFDIYKQIFSLEAILTELEFNFINNKITGKTIFSRFEESSIYVGTSNNFIGIIAGHNIDASNTVLSHLTSKYPLSEQIIRNSYQTIDEFILNYKGVDISILSTKDLDLYTYLSILSTVFKSDFQQN